MLVEYNPIVPIGLVGTGNVSIGLKSNGNIFAETPITKPVTMQISSDTTSMEAGVNNSGIIDIGLEGGGAHVSNDYNALINKPKLNGVTLVDDKSFDDIALKTISTSELLRILR